MRTWYKFTTAMSSCNGHTRQVQQAAITSQRMSLTVRDLQTNRLTRSCSLMIEWSGGACGVCGGGGGGQGLGKGAAHACRLAFPPDVQYTPPDWVNFKFGMILLPDALPFQPVWTSRHHSGKDSNNLPGNFETHWHRLSERAFKKSSFTDRERPTRLKSKLEYK